LEANGIPTVIMGCAKDIVEHVGVPRLWFSNFPLGHSAGKPFDTASQHGTLAGALSLFDHASKARTTFMSDQTWSESNAWEKDFWDLSHLSAADLAKLKAEHEKVRVTAAKIKTD
jgi:hypothetical protein